MHTHARIHTHTHTHTVLHVSESSGWEPYIVPGSPLQTVLTKKIY